MVSRNARPRNFELLTLGVFLLGLLGWFYYTPKSAAWLAAVVIGTILTPVLFWFGLNFARVVVLIGAVADILAFIIRLPQFAHSALLGQLALVVRLCLALF